MIIFKYLTILYKLKSPKREIFYDFRPVINRYKIAITAKTKRMWIKLPTASPKPKYPIAHKIINITAIVLIKFPIIVYFKWFNDLNNNNA